MGKIYKTWKIHADLYIGCGATNDIKWVQQDNYAYLIEINFVYNRRPIADLEGIVILKFTLPNKTILKYELVDIQGDKGVFLVPSEILTQNGTTILEIEWWKAGEIKNIPTPLPIQIQTNPWEVVE